MSELDGIDALDWGAYSHFRLKADQFPELAQFMLTAYYLSSYVSIGVLFTLAALVFYWRGRYWSTHVTAATLAVAVGLIYSLQLLFPRRRPPDAQIWLGADIWQDSYPSAGMLLFTLGMALLGIAIWQIMSYWGRAAYVLIAGALVGLVFYGQLFLSLHFLTDLFGGLAGAVLLALLAYPFLRADRHSEAEA